MAVAGNQLPVTVVATDVISGVLTTWKVQPLVGLTGGDGTRISRATKVADMPWRPFLGLAEASTFVAAPAGRTTTTADKTALIAAGLADL